jgi:two-component system OmpR family sensor kinase
VKRVPIRRRLTVAFAVVMALVLAAGGLFLHERMKANLNRALDGALRARATDLAALAQQSDSGLADARLPPGATALGPAQLISSSGRVVDRSPGAPPIPLLTASALRGTRAATPLIVDHRSPGESATRLLARSIPAQGQRMVVVVGSSLEPVDTALGSLDSQLLLGGPVVLVLASLAASVLAGGALRPVEAMRRRAAAFSGHDLGQRLPNTAADDELGRLARTLNAMLDRVEQAVHQERSFIANASHELRSPLTALQAELELIARDRPRGNALDHQVASAIEETDRLNNITSGLLLLARADSREFVLRRRPVDVSTLLTEATARTPGDGPTVSIMSGPELTIDADRELLTQAMSNLIGNARRHARSDVTIAATADRDGLELRVLDDGPGFPDTFLPRAFDRFTRADAGRTSDGAGLGLSIAQAIAELHGGTAHASNRPTGGAEVRIRLPVAAQNSRPASCRALPARGTHAHF